MGYLTASIPMELTKNDFEEIIRCLKLSDDEINELKKYVEFAKIRRKILGEKKVSIPSYVNGVDLVRFYAKKIGSIRLFTYLISWYFRLKDMDMKKWDELFRIYEGIPAKNPLMYYFAARFLVGKEFKKRTVGFYIDENFELLRMMNFCPIIPLSLYRKMEWNDRIDADGFLISLDKFMAIAENEIKYLTRIIILTALFDSNGTIDEKIVIAMKSKNKIEVTMKILDVIGMKYEMNKRGFVIDIPKSEIADMYDLSFVSEKKELLFKYFACKNSFTGMRRKLISEIMNKDLVLIGR